MSELKPGIYRHFKGSRYQVIDIATHSETLETYVVYREVDGSQKLWIRPQEMFLEEIFHDGQKQKRFQYLGENTAEADAAIENKT